MKIVVKQMKKEMLRKRTGGDSLVRYKILEVEGGTLEVVWKVTDVSSDRDPDNTTGGTFYMTEAEFRKAHDDGIEMVVLQIGYSE